MSVRDSGIGIAPGGLEQLFTPFSQIDSGLARKFEGTGLGLAMVKLLAELHGGTVAVESAAGEGSCFTVWFPIRSSTARTLTPASAPMIVRAAPPPIARTALVVDDDFKSAELTRLQLETEHFVVLSAPSAEAALVLALTQPLALIVLDILLPGMDGWAFLSRIKKMSELRRVPVLVVSVAPDADKGRELGAAAVIQKPLAREQLLRALVTLRLSSVVPAEELAS